MPFTRRAIKSNTLGDILKQTRLNRGLKLKDVEKKTDISVKCLEFLEADDFHKFSSPVHIRGSLLLYADFLGLDSREIASRFEREFAQVLAPSRFTAIHQSSKKNLKPRFIQKFSAKAIPLAAITFLILSYLGFNIMRVLSVPEIEIISPLDDLVTNDSSLVVEGMTEEGIDIYINKQLVDQINGHFKEKIELLSGLNIIEISGKKKYSKERVIYRRVVMTENREGNSE